MALPFMIFERAQTNERLLSLQKRINMIQRVQSLYLLLVLIALVMVTIGTDVFVTQVNKKDSFELVTHANVYGVQRDFTMSGTPDEADERFIMSALEKVEVPEENRKGIPTFYFPFYSLGILLSMLTVVVLLSYKNLKRQIKLGRILFILNFLSFGAVLVLYYLLRNETSSLSETYSVSNQLGFGFYCIVIATAFSFLANIGIRRDIKLIQSIDRIR